LIKEKNKIGINPEWSGVFDSIVEPVLIVDSSSKILFANKPALRVFGFSTKTLQNVFTNKLFPGFNKNALHKIKKFRSLEFNGRNKNGKTLYFELTLSILRHKGKNFNALLLHDISKRKKIIEERDRLKEEADKYSQKLASLLENADILLWSVKEDNNGELYYEQVNEAFASASGRKPSEYNGKHLKELGTNEDYKAVVSSLNKAEELGVYIYEKELHHGNKIKYYVIRIIAVPSKKGDSKHFIGSATDITDRKHIEELLKLSEKKYRELTHNAPIAVARLAAETDKFEFVNDEFIRQSGYSLNEFNSLSKREIHEIVHPDDRDALYAAFKVWVNSGFKGTLHHEYRIINKHKNLLWLEAYFYSEFDSNGNLLAVNQIYIDITGRKKAEEKLQIFGHAIESTTEMITITDLNNRFTFINKAFETKYGYTESEMLGKEVGIIGSVKNPLDIQEVVFTDTQKGGWEGELINTKKDGSEFPILLSTSQIKNSDGKVMGYIGIARDITELKNAYDRLRHSLTEKEILLKEVYHRVKNNMQVISSLLNIQSQSVTEPTAIELFRETQNRVRIMQLIHEKLYKSQDLSKIDFSLYIRDLTDQLRRAYPISRNVELTINSEGVYLGVDRAIPCGLIINELVSNAYKYAFKDNKKGNIYIELTIQEDKHVLIVRDNGVGIPETIDFRKSDSLGMILISTLSDQLEGAVEVDRTKGTKFTIRF